MTRHVLTSLALLLALTVAALPSHAATTGFGLGIHGGYGESKDAASGSPLAGVNVVINVAP